MKVAKDWNVGVKPSKIEGQAIYKLSAVRKLEDGTWEGPYSHNVPATDRIQQGGEYKDIAAISKIGKGGEVQQFTEIHFLKTNGWELVLDPKSIVENEIIQYLELCNYNVSNPNRDPQAEAIFYRLDPVKEAKDNLSKDKLYNDAVHRAFNMDVDALKQFVASRGQSDTQDVSIMQELAVAAAKADPAAFLALDVNQEVYAATITRAKEKGLIKFDDAAKAWKWVDTNEVIRKIPKTSDAIGGFASYLKTDEGNAVFQHLQEKVK
jgi:hypothetical protein